MRLFESILDDLEPTSSQVVEKVKEMSAQDADYDFQIEVKFEKTSDDVQKHGEVLRQIAVRIEDVLDASPYIDARSEMEYLSSWPDFTPRQAGVGRILYRRPKVSGVYSVSLRFSVAYSFRRPLQALYFLGQLYSCIKKERDAWLFERFILTDERNKELIVNSHLPYYIMTNRHDTVWRSVQEDTERSLTMIANFMMPCVRAYTDVSAKFDSLNFNNMTFATDSFRNAAYDNIHKKVAIPGYLYVQMEDALISGHGITTSGKFTYFYKNIISSNKKLVSYDQAESRKTLEPWINLYVTDELDRHPRKPQYILAHTYKNVYLNLFIILGPFYNEESRFPFLFAVNFQGYVLDEPYADEFAANICENLFSGQVSTRDFKRFIKETFPDNYAKQND